VQVQNTLRLGGQAFFRPTVSRRPSLIRRLPLPFLICARNGLRDDTGIVIQERVPVRATKTLMV
jgi:hypothetical protein